MKNNYSKMETWSTPVSWSKYYKHLLVEVRLEIFNTGRFLIDTGSRETSISVTMFKNCQLDKRRKPLIKYSKKHFLDGKKILLSYFEAELGFGGTIFSVPIIVYPDRYWNLEHHMGVLGMNFLEVHHCSIKNLHKKHPKLSGIKCNVCLLNGPYLPPLPSLIYEKVTINNQWQVKAVIVTSSEVSYIPRNWTFRMDLTLKSVKKTKLAYHSEHTERIGKKVHVKLSCESHTKNFKHKMYVSDHLPMIILGKDFLQHFKTLLIQPRSQYCQTFNHNNENSSLITK